MNDLQIVTFDGVDVVDSRDIAVMVERDHGELLKKHPGLHPILSRRRSSLGRFLP